MISKIFYILMYLIIAIRKKFKNVPMFPFLECFGEEHKFETCFEIFLGK